MKMKRKYFFILALVFAFCSGCGNEEGQKEQQTKITETAQEINTEMEKETEKLLGNESEAAVTDEVIEEEFETGAFDGSDFD